MISRSSTGSALRLTSLAAAAAMALLVTTAFLCAAVFVFVLEKYGPVQACLTGAAIFFVVTLIAAGCYMVRKKQIEARARRKAAKAAKSTAQTVLSDPMLVAAGIQVIRAIGVKKLIPILAVGGLALGFFASRANASGGQRSAGGVAGCRAFHSCASVGWVERSDTHRCRCVWRWVSLRSTHPTKNDFAISRLRPRFASSFAA